MDFIRLIPIIAGVSACLASAPALGVASSPQPQPSPRAAAPAAPARGVTVDLERFTVEGVGLASSADEVKKGLGAPEETRKISSPMEPAQREDQEEEEAGDFDRRPPETRHDRIIYSYFKKGVQVVFDECDMRIERFELFVAVHPPYLKLEGVIAGGIPLEVREEKLLHPLAKQIYKDVKGVLFLSRDGSAPIRESAVLDFNLEGWLTKITFLREENLVIDLDRLSVAGISLGDHTTKALEVLGPPDAYGVGKANTGSWEREGIRIYAGKSDERIYRIAVTPRSFDGDFEGPLALTARKPAFHDYLGDRICQEATFRISAYRKGEPLSREKLILKFDEDERLKSLSLSYADNVKIDFEEMSIAGVKVGDGAPEVRKRLGAFGKSRETRDRVILGYPNRGMRVVVRKNETRERRKGERVTWPELGVVERLEADPALWGGLYAEPLTLAETIEDYEAEAGDRIFRRKKETLYMSADGEPPARGVAGVVDFERAGWPRMVVFRAFQEIVVDMKAFTVSGVGLGTHADEVTRVFGRPEKARVSSDEIGILTYLEKGLTIAVDQKDRKVCKIIVDMEKFEGGFAQEITVDSGADGFEKALQSVIYAQDEKQLRLTKDGGKPVWEEGVVEFGLSGDVKRLVFMTLAVKHEGILIDITKEFD